MAAEGDDTQYDFYILSDDAKWEKKVLHDLQKLKPGIKCLSRRDSKPGLFKIQNLIDPIKRCKKVVVGFTSKQSTGDQEFVATTTVQDMLDKNTLKLGKFIPVKITEDAEIPENFNSISYVKGWEEDFYNTFLDNIPSVPVPCTEGTDSKSLLQQRMNDPKYQNWVKSGLALMPLNECLQPIAEEKLVEFHETLKLKINRKCVSNCEPRKKKVCPICSEWKKHILQNHKDYGRKQGPNLTWSNVDPKLWPTEKWEVGKMYMSPGQKPGKYEPDISSAVNFMIFCKIFYPNGQEHKNNSELEAVRNVRNNTMHSGYLKVEDQDLGDNLGKIITMFNKLEDDGHDVKSNKEVVEELKTIKFEVNAAGLILNSSSKLSKVDLVQEEINLLSQTYRALKEDQLSNQNEFKDFLMKYEDLKVKFKDEITEIKERLTNLEGDFTDLKGRVDTVEKNKAQDEESQSIAVRFEKTVTVSKTIKCVQETIHTGYAQPESQYVSGQQSKPDEKDLETYEQLDQPIDIEEQASP